MRFFELGAGFEPTTYDESGECMPHIARHLLGGETLIALPTELSQRFRRFYFRVVIEE